MYVMRMAGKTPKTSTPVKSAMRVVEILEFFAQRQSGATVTDVAASLDYPQSSTSMLMSSLVSMGYLKLEDETRLYLPTLRVMLLGLWLHDTLFNETSLMQSMKELTLRTRGGVMVGLRQGESVRFILSLASGGAGSPRFPSGVVRPICWSAAGKALLAGERDDEVVRIAESANSHLPTSQRVVVSELLTEVRECRRRGWAESSHYPRQGWANLAMQLPRIESQPLMALTLGVRMEALALHRDDLVEMVKRALDPLHR